MTISLHTWDILTGRRERTVTMTKSKVLDRGIVVLRRTRSGIGRDGVVTMIEGIPRSKVRAPRDRMNGPRRSLGVSWT